MRAMMLEPIRRRFENDDWDKADLDWLLDRAQLAALLGARLEELWTHEILCPNCRTRIRLRPMTQQNSEVTR